MEGISPLKGIVTGKDPGILKGLKSGHCGKTKATDCIMMVVRYMGHRVNRQGHIKDAVLNSKGNRKLLTVLK